MTEPQSEEPQPRCESLPYQLFTSVLGAFGCMPSPMFEDEGETAVDSDGTIWRKWYRVGEPSLPWSWVPEPQDLPVHFVAIAEVCEGLRIDQVEFYEMADEIYENL